MRSGTRLGIEWRRDDVVRSGDDRYSGLRRDFDDIFILSSSLLLYNYVNVNDCQSLDSLKIKE